MRFHIMGTGSYLPEWVLTNAELSTMVDTNDEWITKRVGIEQRHISTTETTSDMALKAAQLALANSGVTAQELDMILVATITADKICPTVACQVQRDLGATCPAMDLNAACTGFLFALETAAAYLALGKVKKVLVIGAERLSSIVNWQDRSTCIIFGDGAGAVVVSNEGDKLLSSILHSQGGEDALHIPHIVGVSPFYKGKENAHTYIEMDGQKTYRFAVGALQENTTYVMEQAGLTDGDIRWVIAHQANMRIIKEAARKLPIAPEKFCTNINRVGNTSSASVAILLDELNQAGKLTRGDKIILTAFGGGLCSGACAIEW